MVKKQRQVKKPLTEQQKLQRQIKKLLGDNYETTDDVLIDSVLSWLEIESAAKAELKNDLENGGGSIAGSWQLLTTLAMASKQIQQLYTKLGITPQERAKLKAVETDNDISIEDALK